MPKIITMWPIRSLVALNSLWRGKHFHLHWLFFPCYTISWPLTGPPLISQSLIPLLHNGLMEFIYLCLTYILHSLRSITRAKKNCSAFEASIRPLRRMIMIKVEYIYRSRRVRKIYKGSERSLGWPGRRVAPSFGTSWENEGKESERYEGSKVTQGGITCVRILSRYTRSFRTPLREVNVLSRRSHPCNFSEN